MASPPRIATALWDGLLAAQFAGYTSAMRAGESELDECKYVKEKSIKATAALRLSRARKGGRLKQEEARDRRQNASSSQLET